MVNTAFKTPDTPIAPHDVFVRESKNLMDSQESLVVQYETVRRPCLYSFNSFTCGPGQMFFGGSDPRSKVDLCLVHEAEGQGPVRWHLINYHGRVHRAPHIFEDTFIPNPKEAWCNEVTCQDNTMKRLYANLMSSVFPERVQFSFDFIIEPERFGSHIGLVHGQVTYKSLRTLLASEFRDESVLGFPQTTMTWETLEKQICRSDEDNEKHGYDFGCMLTIHSGREMERDGLSHLGFCVQRRLVRMEELGDFTQALALHQCQNNPAEAKKLLQDRLKIPQTLSGVTFHLDGECLSDQYFRFLKLVRKLEGYTISHCIMYKHKKYLTGYMSQLLQQRHEYKLQGNKVFSDLQKLLCNSLFGFSSLDNSKFSRSSCVLESSLRVKKRRRKLLNPDSLQHIQVLGLVTHATKLPEVLVLVTHSQHDAKINNVLQVAGCILSRSKSIFLYALHQLLRNVPVHACEVSYVDTDGAILTCTADLKSLMHDKTQWDALFEQPHSLTHQAGKFKIEAQSRNLIVRAVKMYYMSQEPEAEEPCIKKVKGLPMRLHELLKPSDFIGHDPPAHLIYTRMRAEASGAVVIKTEQRHLISSLNIKRRMTVREPCENLKSCGLWIVFLFTGQFAFGGPRF